MRLLRKTCRIQDLVKRADLNGRMCTVDSFDEASARCAVSVSGGELQVWIKPENLLETLPDEFAHAAQVGDEATVHEWLTDGGDVDAPWFNPEINGHGFTLLMLACSKGHERLVARLLKCGADANALNDGGVDPLMHAAVCMEPGWAACLKLLLKAKARPDWFSDAGGSARGTIRMKLGIGTNLPAVVHGRH
mmetsp:Transcript_24849/g.79748  ORF Transcript_24849/g.79748 Transcript_24849/m.79748 type:complete len:192 (+) Transcript_24849:90-665(+)